MGQEDNRSTGDQANRGKPSPKRGAPWEIIPEAHGAIIQRLPEAFQLMNSRSIAITLALLSPVLKCHGTTAYNRRGASSV